MKKALVLMSVLAMAGTAMGQPSALNPWGYWQLEGNADDSSGNDRHGTPHGSLYSFVAGAPVGASPAMGISAQPDPLDPTDNAYITVPGAGFDHSAGFTAAAWMNRENIGWGTSTDAGSPSMIGGYGHTIIGQGQVDSHPEGWMLKRRGGTSRQMAFRVGATRLTTDIDLAADTWYFIAGTFDGITGAMNMYVFTEDGNLWIQKSGTAAGIVDNTGDINIGRLDPQPHTYGSWTADPHKGGQGFWRGTLDEVQLYDRPLCPMDLAVAMVPEPASLLLLASSVLFLRRRRS